MIKNSKRLRLEITNAVWKKQLMIEKRMQTSFRAEAGVDMTEPPGERSRNGGWI